MNIFKPYKYYEKEEIERLAERLLQEVQANRRRLLKDADVAEAVADFLDLKIVWAPLESDAEGQIAAMILPVEQTIFINEAIPALRDGFGRSTIAHEIGHWILHIDRKAVINYIDRLENGLETTTQPFLCRGVNSGRGVEWQAQYFASCLLMPISKLQDKQRRRNLTNWKHLKAMADELGVTISNLKNRLQSLDWITISPGCRQIYLGKSAPKQ